MKILLHIPLAKLSLSAFLNVTSMGLSNYSFVGHVNFLSKSAEISMIILIIFRKREKRKIKYTIIVLQIVNMMFLKS